MRIVKEHDTRKNEIMDVTENLFYQKGYERCTINDILREVGIAKGTFYHYFNSKEEALDAIVARSIAAIVERVNQSISGINDQPIRKLMHVFLSMRMADKIEKDTLDEMHKPDNALLHQKNLSELVKAIAPILEGIVIDGNALGVWNCPYPLEYMKIFLSSSLTLTDGGMFELDQQAQQKTMMALISVLEKMLNLSENTLLHLYLENWS